jgi:hypothetical protein
VGHCDKNAFNVQRLLLLQFPIQTSQHRRGYACGTLLLYFRNVHRLLSQMDGSATRVPHVCIVRQGDWKRTTGDGCEGRTHLGRFQNTCPRTRIAPGMRKMRTRSRKLGTKTEAFTRRTELYLLSLPLVSDSLLPLLKFGAKERKWHERTAGPANVIYLPYEPLCNSVLKVDIASNLW